MIHKLYVRTVEVKTKSWYCTIWRTAIAQFVAGDALIGKGVSILVQMHGMKKPHHLSHLFFLTLQ